MRTIALTCMLVALCGTAYVRAADSPELAAALAKVDTASKELITLTRQRETEVATLRSQVAALNDQLATAQAQVQQAQAAAAAATAARDAALAERDKAIAAADAARRAAAILAPYAATAPGTEPPSVSLAQLELGAARAITAIEPL